MNRGMAASRGGGVLEVKFVYIGGIGSSRGVDSTNDDKLVNGWIGEESRIQDAKK